MKLFWPALKLLLLLTILTGIIYPLSILFIANLTMPQLAQGSLIYKNNRLIGSKLIAQKTNKEIYFWSRPSASDYDALPAMSSNLGPISLKLKKLIEKRRLKIAQTHHVQDLELIPNELVCSSASGLDPHISLNSALFQLERVAKARQIKEEKIYELIMNNISLPSGKLFGPPIINVLLLNLELDDYGQRKQ
jgi:K+-transporting ATPase ATPase C chain